MNKGAMEASIADHVAELEFDLRMALAGTGATVKRGSTLHLVVLAPGCNGLDVWVDPVTPSERTRCLGPVTFSGMTTGSDPSVYQSRWFACARQVAVEHVCEHVSVANPYRDAGEREGASFTNAVHATA